ncbi:hypothetical protein AJ80_02766 [Polytolypa hystricis UAMH7299]|uniref:MARVEL domain-containing protein n=1 Tax=Polytolypa hystricis (strain UAMH7299) TaxID=1447883 RepID=A0A2B7YNC4_POLH7|nr:hypothetical protein AJ80_02766 [Polytolypa hystricis UAMH7299]
MALNLTLILRGVQALLAFIVFAMSCYVVSEFRGALSGSPDQPNFMLFNGLWTAFIALPFLVLAPIYFASFAHIYALLAVEAVTMIFWFAGFIALGAALPAPKWCHGSVCNSMQAITVFGAFEWLLLVGTLTLAVLPVIRNRGAKSNNPATAEVQPGV